MAKEPTISELEDRVFQEIMHCQTIMQYLDDLYSPENHHILEHAKDYFNVLYIIKIDYLKARLLRFFDPDKTAGKENFSIEKIHILLPDLELKNYSKDKTIRNLKEYRNKYLSHNDFKLSRESFPTYFEIKGDLEIIIAYVFDVLDKIRALNGKGDSEQSRQIPCDSYVSYYSLLINGTYIQTHPKDEDILKLKKKARDWHKKNKQKIG